MLENKAFHWVYYSRFIASWYKAGGEEIEYDESRFKKWLSQIEFWDCDEPIRHKLVDGKWVIENEDKIVKSYMPEEVIDEIYWFGTNGKLELQNNAKVFLAKNK